MSLSPKQRLALIKRVNSLMQADFEALIFALKVPQGVISSDRAPQGNRASELLKWVEGPTGCGMDKFLSTLTEIAPFKTETFNPETPGNPRLSSERFAKSLITNIVKWTPSGVGIGLTVHEILIREWPQAVLMSCVTAASSLWVSFSGRFMEEAEKEAAERGGGLAKWVFAVGDRTAIALQHQTAQAWRYLTSDFENKYYQRLIYICRNYETKGLDKERVLKLQHMFVPLKISPTSLTNISPDLLQKLPETLSKQQEIGELLSLMAHDSSFRRLAILGVPGSGKTTLMRYLTLIYASRQQRRLLHPKAPKFIPVLMYLRDVREDIVQNPKLSLVELIDRWVRRLQTINPLKSPPHWFAQQLMHKNCLILLDGLDEIADDSERQMVSQWVDVQMEEYPETPFILTSRPLGYKHAKLQKDVTVLEVQPFSLKQVQQFIHSWYLETEIRSQENTDDLGVRDEAHRQADDLVKRIQDSASLVAMAVNPLLLTMIATVHRRGSALPGKRVELYKEICQVLLEKRQRAKGIPDSLAATQKQSVLQSLALELMQANTRSFTLSSAVDSLLQSRLAKVSNEPLISADFLKQMREVSALLVEKEEGVYEFAHLSFQEYLAAVEIRDLNQDSLLIGALNDVSQLSWWAETIRLYAAQGDSSGLIKAAICASTVEALALAVDCLEEGQRVDPPIRQELDTILDEGLESTQKERFTLAAQVRLTRRLKALLRVDERVEIDMSYVTCAEYQLFIDAHQTAQTYVQPDHWTSYRFAPGTAKQPIVGIRANDAIAFCDWLTQQQVPPVFRYRLPTSLEVNEQSLSGNIIGCWCKDGESYGMGGIKIQQWVVWKKKLLEKEIEFFNIDLDLDYTLTRGLNCDLDLDCALDLDFDHTLTLDLNLDLNRACALDLVCALDRDLDRARDLASDLALALASDLDRDFTLVFDLALNRDCVHDRVFNRALDRDRALAFALDHDRALDRDLDRALALARDLTRDRTRARARARDLALAVDLARARARDRARDRDRVLACVRDRALDLNRVRTRARARALDLAHDLNRDFDRDRDRDLVRALDLNRALSLDLALARWRVRALALVLFRTHSRKQILGYTRQYLLSSITFLTLQIDAYDHVVSKASASQRSNRDRKRQYDQLIESLIAYRGEIYQLYYLFVLIDLRRQGEMPAWEGLRIVRERIDE